MLSSVLYPRLSCIASFFKIVLFLCERSAQPAPTSTTGAVVFVRVSKKIVLVVRG
jgi:hypothetical protein